jgi:hypothetical protein
LPKIESGKSHAEIEVYPVANDEGRAINLLRVGFCVALYRERHWKHTDERGIIKVKKAPQLYPNKQIAIKPCKRER